jgi:hypothetical protein
MLVITGILGRSDSGDSFVGTFIIPTISPYIPK